MDAPSRDPAHDESAAPARPHAEPPEADRLGHPLAARVDYEVARALEWRGDELVPLPGAALAEETLDAERSALPAQLASARARALLRRGQSTPGSLALSLVRLVAGLACVAALVAGWQVLDVALGAPGGEPVNVGLFLAATLGLQTLFLVVALAALLPPTRRAAASLLTVGGATLAAAVRLATRRVRTGETSQERADVGPEVAARLASAGALKPLALLVSHGAWTAFNVGLLVAGVLVLSARHHEFAWQSTFIGEPDRAAQVLSVLMLPAAVGPGLPDEPQVRASRWDPSAGRFEAAPGVEADPLALRQRWGAQLLAAIAGWGLLPRLVLLLGAWAAWARARRRLIPSDDAYADAIARRLRPVFSSHAEPATDASAPEPGATAREPAPSARPASWHAAPLHSAARDADPVAALWGERPKDWSALPRLDSRHAESEAIALVERAKHPAGVVLLADYRTTPDASVGRLVDALREAAGPAGRVAIVLTGGPRFRERRHGGGAEAVERRRRVWSESAASWGIPGSHLVDFDLDSATPDARAALAARLGVGRPDAAPDADPDQTRAARDFERALELVERQAPEWQRRLEAVSGEERERVALRLAAEARRAVDGAFDAPEPDASRPSAGAPPLRRVIAEHLSLPADLPERSLDVASRQLGAAARVLARVPNLDPRFVAAGIAAGFLAGPLGGAIAAGSAGLVAGASLSGTLGAVGGLLGGSLAWRRAGRDGRRGGARSIDLPDEGFGDAAARSAETATDPNDLLGLPARTALVRAVTLAWQGRGEPAIAAALAALDARPETRETLPDAESVRALCVAARLAAAPDAFGETEEPDAFGETEEPPS